MNMIKEIYWIPDANDPNGDEQFACVHLLVGYSEYSLKAYQEMATELRKTFPQAKDSELICTHVSESNFYEGFTLLSWTSKMPRQTYEGWDASTEAPEYRWSS